MKEMIIATGVALAVVIVGWVYQALKPPKPKKFVVTSPRVKLDDGRYLAYKECGVPKEEAKYKIIMSHGYDNDKTMHLPTSQEFWEELKIYLVLYDRAGYGDSDPHPSRSVKTEAFDIEELADKLQLGTKFYVIGCSLGAYPIWSCLNYIPHRLLGASLVVPFVNYWWTSIPSALLKESFEKLPKSFRRTFGIAHYTPWLYYWWTKQKWFPLLSMFDEDMFTHSDLEIIKGISELPSQAQKKTRQQGEHESINRDTLASYGKWEFDPISLRNTFSDDDDDKNKKNGIIVDMWQGSADRVIPVELNKFIADKLPWIRYHEIPDAGHALFGDPLSFETIIRSLLAE